MLTTPVGIDGLVKGDVGRLVAREDALGALLDDLGAGRQGLGIEALGQRAPAIIELLALFALEAVRQRPGRAPPFQGVGGDVERLLRRNRRQRALGAAWWEGWHTVRLYSISRIPFAQFTPAAVAPHSGAQHPGLDQETRG